MSAIITVKNLVKRYGSMTAVNDISFSVESGEIFGLLGPNGAGKTTTLEMIETLKKPTSGQITVDGLSAADNAEEIKQRIGIQLQSAGFYPYLNLVELLEMFGVMYGVTVQPLAMLAMFNLEDKAKSVFTAMSGGQKQRFSLATTLINQPKIIFLDEPTTGLDPQARINLWEVIRQIKARGVTIVITTHYMDEAEQLCDRLAIMDHGQLIAEGTPSQLISDLLKRGFTRHTEVKPATLEDVFLDLTGHGLRGI
ncbi:MAG: antibiotic transport system ATP-binding protein [Candidatus Berkelbacteria bacterium Gr01-1014_85]|uniref:Antibiotic transport system ATP-binding protein n=1 Tax=Candidatus Berkelbacteria bacterium Gr01-1014_85 TaxID=2017150 RepID=A0A554J9J6_9BACT|nr:MAG: antibiotic transport system ATP-binding protein [Candidatus Berkelbacteria bacterium Gr01-1014_85]